MRGDEAWRRREASRKRKNLIWQAALLLCLCALIGSFVFNVSSNLAARNIHSGFAFLSEKAGFQIGESPISFESTDSYFRAFAAGLANTVKVSVISIFSATLLGLVVALMRLSRHPLIKFLGAAHVEFYRNIPLLVQLLLIYLVITELLPGSLDAIHFGSWGLLSNAGFQFATPANNWTSIGISFLSALFCAFCVRRMLISRFTGLIAAGFAFVCALFCFAAVWVICGFADGWSIPKVEGFAVEGGTLLSAEFLALWLGLTLFTSTSIAEIIRAGILAVPKGQWNAAKALGMTYTESVSYVILPQALKLAVPPLASQFMNLTKNSSLAVVVGYPDLVSIANSTINLNGQALEAIVVIMSVYLFLNLVISVLMNRLNLAVTRGSR